MAKFRPAKGKAKGTKAPQGGLPCVIFLISALLLGMLFLWWVMKNYANG